MPGKVIRGSVVDIKLDPIAGHETGKARPCVVIQNNVGNACSPVTIVAAITGAENVPKLYPVNVRVPKGEGGLTKESVVLCDQIRSVDERRFGKFHGVLTDATMEKVDMALRISLALNSQPAQP